MSVVLHHGDCLEVMRGMAEASVDAVVTDPPYHLTSIVKRFGSENAAPVEDGVYARSSAGFMGKQWDGGDIAFRPEMWAETLRLLKPGGHLVAFSGTRTYHRMVCAIEDAGFEIRDQLAWVYGSGFPKSHNQKGEWEGWGTALKPAWEPILLGRKPLVGTVAANVAAHGTGALNVDGCRIESGERPALEHTGRSGKVYGAGLEGSRSIGTTSLGRWPANVALDEAAAAMLDQQSGERKGASSNSSPSTDVGFTRGAGGIPLRPGYSDTGGASRFFYCAKASRSERGDGNHHPTVKPIALMRWLCRLVTPPGGLVLDPFAGSGTTGCAAILEGVRFIGFEREAEYVEIARRRIAHHQTLFSVPTNQ